MQVPASLSAEWEVLKILHVVWPLLVGPSPQSSLSDWTLVLPTPYTYYGIEYYKVSEC